MTIPEDPGFQGRLGILLEKVVTGVFFKVDFDIFQFRADCRAELDTVPRAVESQALCTFQPNDRRKTPCPFTKSQLYSQNPTTR